MAKRLASGSSKNRADSPGRHHGFKVFPGSWIGAGTIALRQLGTRWRAGLNTTMGRDHTINATASGTLSSRVWRGKRFLEVLV